MDPSTFQTHLEQERKRLIDLREQALARRKTIDDEIADYDNELAAIAAYENVKSGKTVSTSRSPRATGRRAEVLNLIATKPAGMTRSDILEAMGLKGDKSGEQSISNALSNLKKQGKLDQQGGKYVASAA